MGEAVQEPNNSVGSFAGLDRRKEKKKNPDCSCPERSIRTRHLTVCLPRAERILNWQHEQIAAIYGTIKGSIITLWSQLAYI